MPYKKLHLPKKLLAIALCALLFAGILPVTPTTAYAADLGNIMIGNSGGAVTQNNVNDALNSAGVGPGDTYTVTFINNPTSIENSAFNGRTGLSGMLTIPDSVTLIELNAFRGCTGLTALSLPATGSLVINGSAFNGCTGLTGTLTIPSGVKSIGVSAFQGCTGLTALSLPASGSLVIGDSTFSGCTGLTGSLTIPSGVTSIGDSAFNGTGITFFVFKGTTPPTIGDPIHGTAVVYYPAAWGALPNGLAQMTTTAYSVNNSASQTVTVGGNVGFTVTVTGSSDPAALTYQWQENNGGGWRDITGETATTLALTGVQLADSGNQYRCAVTDPVWQEEISSAATLTVNEAPAVNSVSVLPKTATVLKGRTQPFTAIVNVDGGADDTVTWSVNSTLSTIDSAGWLSVSPDETATTLTVTATSTFDTTKKDTATVTVREPVDTVYYFTTDFGTYTGQSEGLTGVIDANISAFTGLEVNGELLHGSNYSTNAGSTIITLYPSYLDTLDNGTYTVRALFTEGYAEGSFTVNRQDNAVSVTGVALDKSTAALTVGKTVQLTATVSPSNATNKGLTWASSDTTVATVDANGNVKGVKSGAATITVTTDDGGYTATCKMTVTNAADSPQTGDSGNMMLWIITGLSSILIGLSLLVWRKRQQLKENA